MAYYFISDLHLRADRPALVSLLRHFLTHIATDATHLFILGDFFDAWIGDDEDSEAAAVIKRISQNVSEQGVSGFFQHGNRDFLIGDKFASDTGFTLLKEQHILDLYGETALLMHGDSLCTDDHEYQQFRAQVRNLAWQQQVLALPLPQRRAMAAQMREKSQSMNSIKAEDIMDVNAEAVRQTMEQCATKLLIHGHTHRPGEHELTPLGTRIVLGDWSDNLGWYLKVTPKKRELTSFSL